MRWTAWTGRAVVLLLVLATAACGGGDDGEDSASATEPAALTPEEVATDPTALSAEQWTADAGDLCQPWADDITSVEGVDADTTAEVAELTEAFADDLGELAQPIDITEEAAAFVAAVGDMADAYAALADELAAGASVEDSALDEAQASYGEVEAVAEELAASEFECEFHPTGVDAEAEYDEPAGGIDGDGIDPRDVVAEFGDDTDLANLAFLCFTGSFERCDDLYDEAPDSDAEDSFQHYAATCGGRLEEEQPGECEALAG